jgi:S1-C subfamily serine protease
MSQLAASDPGSSSFSQLSSALAGAVDRASPSVVRVDRRRGSGTGIAWSEDLVVTTSFHAPDRTIVAFIGADGGLVEAEAELVGRDPGTDVAVLRVLGGGLTPATFRALDGLSVGQLALALGRPGKTVRASLRIVGALSTDEVRTPGGGRLERWVETDRQIPRGFGGGPVVDARGEVIGMATRTLFRGADLTVPTATLRRVVDEILAHGGVRRGYLGVGAYPVALPAPHATDLAQESGALVASIEDGGPAATAGLLVGDILVRLDGASIGGPLDLRTALLDRGGKTVDAEVIRAGVRQTISVTIGEKS